LFYDFDLNFGCLEVNARLVCVSPYSIHKNPSLTRHGFCCCPAWHYAKGDSGELPSAGRGGWWGGVILATPMLPKFSHFYG